MSLPEIPSEAFGALLEHLSDHPIPINRYRRSVGEGRSQCYGMVRKRSMAPDLSRCSWLDAKLHGLLIDFGKKHLPPQFSFTSIQVNMNYNCAPHFDKHNAGDSFIVAFGDYTGGELVLKRDQETSYDIRHKPLLFNGSLIEHYTKNWVGNRISLVYHTLVAPTRFPMIRSLSDYEAVLRDEWVIAFKTPEGIKYLTRKSGLPHPLKGRKKL